MGITSTSYGVENAQTWHPQQQVQQVQQAQQPMNAFIPEDAQRLFW